MCRSREQIMICSRGRDEHTHIHTRASVRMYTCVNEDASCVEFSEQNK